ncbi:MAG: type II secretion system F family protein [Candidatus Pacebacteria bacterium]|nr:type II secretion system F family protein [Candidatus Paceibacterota bacterium]
MPIFLYKAKNQKNETLKGKVEAMSVQQASAILKEKGMFIVSLSQAGHSDFDALNAMFDKVKNEDIVNFTRQLSTMITAGLTLTESFAILQQQSKPAMQKIVGSLLREVEGGTSFADALTKQQGIFSRVYIALVRSGESAGVLDQVLKRLADNLEKQHEFAAKTKGALVYPVIVLIAMAVVMFVMMVFVIPKLTSMYQDFGAELPGMTKALISMSNFAVRFWYLFIVGGFGSVYLLKAWRQTPFGDWQIDSLLLKIPVYGILKVQIMMTEFSRTVALLLGAGVSLLSALQIVSESLDSVVFRTSLKNVADSVEKGVSFADAMSRQDQFPPLVSQMIAVGEETGKLDEVLLKLSAYYESESEHAVKNLSTALEPLIMIVLGIGVGFLIVAIVLPIYDLTSKF